MFSAQTSCRNARSTSSFKAMANSHEEVKFMSTRSASARNINHVNFAPFSLTRKIFAAKRARLFFTLTKNI
jgi:hypothetical protein